MEFNMKTNFVNTNDIQINKNMLVTCGLNTCMFICIRTSSYLVGWHASKANSLGVNMKRISFILNRINKKEFIEGYIIPGIDRKKDLSLKKDCRTMKIYPNTDPVYSRNFILDTLRQYPWGKKMKVLHRVTDYKHLIFFTINRSKPFEVKDKDFHDKTCCFDGGKDLYPLL